MTTIRRKEDEPFVYNLRAILYKLCTSNIPEEHQDVYALYLLNGEARKPAC